MAYVLWWVGVPWTVGVTSVTVVLLVEKNVADDRSVTPVVFLPLISVMTLGTTAGLLCEYGVGITARMAVPVLVTGYVAVGYALFLSLVYYGFVAVSNCVSCAMCRVYIDGVRGTL